MNSDNYFITLEKLQKAADLVSAKDKDSTLELQILELIDDLKRNYQQKAAPFNDAAEWSQNNLRFNPR